MSRMPREVAIYRAGPPSTLVSRLKETWNVALSWFSNSGLHETKNCSFSTFRFFQPTPDDENTTAPRRLVLSEELKDVSGEESNRYEFTPLAATLEKDWQLVSFRADRPFLLQGIVSSFGVVLPYFEFRIELATKKTYFWGGFDEIGGKLGFCLSF